jgi:hypothetical protein
MHFRKLLLVAIAVAVVTFSAGVQGQGLIDGIRVTLPESVTVGDKVLEPGEYEIRRPSSANRDILQIFNKGKMVYETNVLTVATGPDEKDPKETKVILHRIGDAHYFDKIWMEDKNYGWEFPLPERVRALQRENSLNVAARYESSQVTASEPYSGPGLAAQLDAIADQDAGPGLAAQLDVIAEQDNQQALALAESESQARADRERQEQADRDRQAELDRQAQLDRERQEQADRDRVAALQTEESEVRAIEPQSRSDAPEELPRTATNWLALLLGGVALVALSLFVRPARAQG